MPLIVYTEWQIRQVLHKYVYDCESNTEGPDTGIKSIRIVEIISWPLNEEGKV